MDGARVSINGFGRMGRLALRAAWSGPQLDVVHINELNGDAAISAHLLTFVPKGFAQVLTPPPLRVEVG